MGCSHGIPIYARENRPSKAHSKTQMRITQALKKRQKADQDRATFEKILLKFDKLRKVISQIKSVYNNIAVNGSLNFEGLHQAMNALHGEMAKEEIADLFEFVDLDSSKTIEFKEFLVAMTVGHVLEIVPTFQGMNADSLLDLSKRETAKGEYSTEMSSGGGSNKTEDIHKMLNLIVSAYLLFDPKACGYINRNAVEALVGEGKHRNAMLSQHRWNEMDWDANGKIDFAEFVHAFSSWVVDIDPDVE